VERVKFYSVSDLGGGHQLKKAEKIIKEFDEKEEYGIVDILEFYNITKYIDNDVYLAHWDDKFKEQVKVICSKMKNKIFKYFDDNLNEESMISIIKEVPNQYIEDFLEIFEKKIDTINVSSDSFIQMVKERKIPIEYILYHKKLVWKYDKSIRDEMLKDAEISAEILLKKYYINEERYVELKIPESLSMEDKEEILIKYIDCEFPNLNYIRIIAKIQSNRDSIIISDKTKLKASRKIIELQNKIFDDAVKIDYKYEVFFDENQREEKDEKYIDSKFICSYSKNWIRDNVNDFSTLMNNFIYLFDFIDIDGRIELINKHHESGIVERTMNLKLLKAYNPNSTFRHKNILALLKLKEYYEELKELNVRIEDIIEWFFDKYLKENFEIENYSISMPSNDSTYFEKCKSILPEFDHILKEYKLFVQDGEIDPELISISSEHMFFKDIPSKIDNKYVYLNPNEDSRHIYYYFFSDQCMLSYVQKTDKKYNSFLELLTKENITCEDYPEYKQKDIEWLLQHDLIYINEDGYIKIKNEELMKVYIELYYKGVISYWRKDENVKKEIDRMVENKELILENTLFSKDEQDYFDFYLNMSKFIDGHDIRNSNLHGTQVGDRKSDVHYSRYLQILLLLILVVLKINDDICLYESNLHKEKKDSEKVDDEKIE